MKLIIALILLTSAVISAENPFLKTFTSDKKPKQVKKSLRQKLEKEGFKVIESIISPKPPVFIINFCKGAPFSHSFPEISLILPCKVFIKAIPGGTEVGTYDTKTAVRLFKDKLTPQELEMINAYGKKVRKIIEGALR